MNKGLGRSTTCNALDRPASRIDSLRVSRASVRPFTTTRCRAQPSNDSLNEASTHHDKRGLDRRAILLSSAGLLLASPSTLHAEGESVETKTLYGLASPPTSYGGYGGNAKEAAKYTYEYPAEWKVEVVGKQEKGMVGIDSRVRNRKVKLETAFTVTFGRAGEDNKRFKLGEVESTLQGFAGADYQLQDALVDSTFKKSGKRTKDDQEFYDYEVFSPETVFLVSVGLKSGKVYALFVKSPSKLFKQHEPELRNIISTFTIIA